MFLIVVIGPVGDCQKVACDDRGPPGAAMPLNL